MNETEAKLGLIECGLGAFCDDHLTMGAEEPLAALFDATVECDALNLTRGDPDVWAAGIAYAFCRMNFILDGGSPCGLEMTRDEFFSFFTDCNRSTVTQKATKIERELEFHHGHPCYSLPGAINGLPRLVELPGGFIGMEKKRSIEISFMDEEESRQLEEDLRKHELKKQEKKEQKAAEREKKRQEELAKKREEERKIQPEFDF